MKLKHFEHLEPYRFLLTFENGEIMQADLKELISSFVAEDALHTARIDPDWGAWSLINEPSISNPKPCINL